MLIWQILAVVIILAFVVIALLAFIEPGPLNRRSRNRHAQEDTTPSDPRDGD
ncbi:MAG: hypothetical protein V9H69_05185 [Anaerolineae bacterium]|jgi:hypothetical protein